MRTQANRTSIRPAPIGAGAGCVDATHNLSGQRLGRKGLDTRERIIKAMQCVLDGTDPAPITLSAIAREAGIGMSTLYLYFPDMGDLLLAVLRRAMDQQEEAFIQCLRTRWPDDALHDHCIHFVRAHFDFWQRHARLLQMRNSFADAHDPRLVAHRYETSRPLIGLLVGQMDADAENGDTLQADCATVLLTGLERMATVLIKPDFHELAGVQSGDARRQYIDRLALAEARLVEVAIRDMRNEGRARAEENMQ